MVFPKCTRTVAILPEDLRERGDLFRPDTGIAGKRRRQFHDCARIVCMVIVAGKECGARGAAEGGGVKTVVPQATFGELFQGGHLDGAAERTAVTESDVVNQDDHHIWRSGWRLDFETRRSFRVAGVERGDRFYGRLCDGE